MRIGDDNLFEIGCRTSPFLLFPHISQPDLSVFESCLTRVVTPSVPFSAPVRSRLAGCMPTSRASALPNAHVRPPINVQRLDLSVSISRRVAHLLRSGCATLVTHHVLVNVQIMTERRPLMCCLFRHTQTVTKLQMLAQRLLIIVELPRRSSTRLLLDRRRSSHWSILHWSILKRSALLPPVHASTAPRTLA